MSSLLIGAMALVLSSAGLAGAAEHPPEESPGNSAADLHIVVSDDCETVTVTSDKDVSNVKFFDETGQIAELEEPSGTTFQVVDGATEVSAKSGTTERSATIDCAPAEASAEEPVDGTGEGAEDDTDGDADADADADEGAEDDTDDDAQDDAGDDAVVGASLDCGDLTVTSTKDLSNVVVVFADGSEQKFDGLSGTSATFTADELDGEVTGVFIKSGNNSDDTDDRNSTGEFVEVTDTGTECNPGTGEGAEDDTDGDDDTDADEGADDDSDTDEGADDDTDDDGTDENVLGGDSGTDVEGDEVLGDDSDVDTGGEAVLGDVAVNNPTVRPAAPVRSTVGPVVPVSQPAVQAVVDRGPQVLGSQVTRTGTLARTGDATTGLVPFGLGLVLLGFGVQRTSKRFSAARVR